jgi:hypothetical protein
MILWKISTAISIKHRILATFNIKKINLSDCMPLRLISLKRYSTILSCIILCCKLGEGVYSVVTAIPTIRNIYKHITNILLIKGPRREEHDKPAAFYLWPINNPLWWSYCNKAKSKLDTNLIKKFWAPKHGNIYIITLGMRRNSFNNLFKIRWIIDSPSTNKSDIHF